jgi:hypothetical protein
LLLRSVLGRFASLQQPAVAAPRLAMKAAEGARFFLRVASCS